MSDDFARILTMLRKERKISQKEAADALGISQALLSHYERGRRGCNLEFVIKASDYYGVSCDYLLGRSPDKTGAQIKVEDIPEPESAKDNVMKGARGSIVATLNKKLIANSINVLYDSLARCGNKQLTTEVSHYLMVAVYKMFRDIYEANPENPCQIFSVTRQKFPGYSNAAMQVVESNIFTLLSGRDPATFEKVTDIEVPSMSAEGLSEEQPLYATSLMNVIQYAENCMALKQEKQ